MRRLAAHLAALLLSCLPFAADSADFSPAQLRGFPRDSLSIESAGRNTELQIWLADTPERQEQGLMFVTDLPAGYGMLFPQQVPRHMTMWMKNTYVALDMLFVGTDGRIIRIAHDTKPLSEEIIPSGGAVSAVLELRAGEARRLGLREGSRVHHRLLP
ncbi:MAG: hypothetical protein RLZZ393_296 [Pseudomonadota bacterium]|jgi:uncharacterized membrane protein (UPF0127 family)